MTRRRSTFKFLEIDFDGIPVTLADAMNGYAEGTITCGMAIAISGCGDVIEFFETLIAHDIWIPSKSTLDDDKWFSEFANSFRSQVE